MSRYKVEPRGSGFEVVDSFTRTGAIVFESASERACVWHARKRNALQQLNSRAALARADAETA